MPDLNPVLSGMTGSYTYAGHWSETPQYGARRQQLGRLFLRLKDPIDKGGLVKELGLTYLVVPNPAAFPQIPYDDLTWLGETVYRVREAVVRLANLIDTSYAYCLELMARSNGQAQPSLQPKRRLTASIESFGAARKMDFAADSR